MVDEGILKDFHVLRPRGFVCNGQANSSGDRIAGMTIEAVTVEEFNRIHALILERIKVIDDQGNDIIRRELLPGLSL